MSWLLLSLPGEQIGAGVEDRRGEVLISLILLQVASGWPPLKVSAPEGWPSFPPQPSLYFHCSNCFLLSSLEDDGSRHLDFSSPGYTCGLHTSLPLLFKKKKPENLL